MINNIVKIPFNNYISLDLDFNSDKNDISNFIDNTKNIMIKLSMVTMTKSHPSNNW